MKENIDLTKVLKDCPVGTKLYSSIHGEVTLFKISNGEYPIEVHDIKQSICTFNKYGKHCSTYEDAECILFPSKYQRDWSKFKLDLAIDSPVMISDDGRIWAFRYYAGNGTYWLEGRKSNNNKGVGFGSYIIPFAKFDPSNIEESLKYNIVYT